MVTEVKGPGSHSITPPKPTLRNVGRADELPQGGAAATSEVVSLTDLSARLKRLTDSLDKLPIVDQAKVAELRKSIESGSYGIDERVIADKLTAFEALISAKGREP